MARGEAKPHPHLANVYERRWTDAFGLRETMELTLLHIDGNIVITVYLGTGVIEMINITISDLPTASMVQAMLGYVILELAKRQEEAIEPTLVADTEPDLEGSRPPTAGEVPS